MILNRFQGIMKGSVKVPYRGKNLGKNLVEENVRRERLSSPTQNFRHSPPTFFPYKVVIVVSADSYRDQYFPLKTVLNL